ncbi:MAG: class II aldolase/adducin family protein [Endomicrobiia bacterium]
MENVKKEIINICKYLAEKEFMLATDGNISYKISSNKILITPKQKNKSNLSVSDLVILNLDGKKVSGKNLPSGEYKLHLMIYKYRKDIKAIIHTHPLFSTILSVADIKLNKPILPEVVFTVKEKIPTIEYAPFYTQDLVNKVKKYIFTSNVFLLKNHGLLALAEDLQKAFFITLKVEQLAKVVYFTKLLGKTNTLSKKQIKDLLKLKKTIV